MPLLITTDRARRSSLIPLGMRLDKGTWQRRLWGFIALAIFLVIIPIVMETINAFLGIFYYGFRAMGFRFTRKAVTIVLPSLLVLTGVAIAVLIVLLATGSESVAVAISDIFSLLVQFAALYLVSLMAVTIGRGRWEGRISSSPRPWYVSSSRPSSPLTSGWWG